jgi:hypothetical protein
MLFVRQERKKRQALLVGCSLFALFAFFTAHKKSVFICVHLWIYIFICLYLRRSARPFSGMVTGARHQSLHFVTAQVCLYHQQGGRHR